MIMSAASVSPTAYRGKLGRKLASSTAAQAAVTTRGLQTVELAAANQAPAAATSRKQRKHERTQELLALFRERWPAAFTRPCPLAIGVNKDVVEALADQATRQEIGAALRLWTSSDVYLRRLATGKPRIGLDGTPGEPATTDQREHANARLMALLRRRTQR